MTIRTLSGVSGIAIVLVVAGVSAASAIDAPARYRHAYRGHLQVHSASVGELRERCAVYGSTVACTFVDIENDRCDIWLPKVGDRVPFLGAPVTITKGFLAGVRAHELAHCNGWPANHPA